MSANRERRRAGRLLGLMLAAWMGMATATATHAQGGEPESFAIRGAKIVPVAGAPIENGTVLVSKGLIEAVGANVTIPADAWVIEGKGLTVYPGLIDSFTDVGISAATDNKPSAISKGPEDRPGTTPWRVGADEVNPGDPRVESWRMAGFTTTVSAPKGGIFPGQASLLNLAGERPGDLVVKTPVAIPVVLTPTGGFRSFPGSQMGVIAYVRQVWIDTNWQANAEGLYAKNPKGGERPYYDRSSAALEEALQKKAIVLLPGNTSLQILRVIKLAGEWKLTTAIYGGQMGYDVATEIAAKKIPVLVDLKWPEGEKDGDPDTQPSLRTLEFRDKAPSTPEALSKAGVKFAFYSGGIATPKDLLPAVKKAIDAGLPADAALRALTLTPAEIYGVDGVLGSIEKGKIANLVVTDGDLFEKKTKIKIVFVDGKKFEVREPVRPSEPPKGDISGKWTMSYTTPEGAEQSKADLTMASDGTISGTVTNERGTATIYSGYASGEKFSFTISLPINGNPTDVTFTGTFEGKTMKGNISAMGYTFEFTGTKPGQGSAAMEGAR